MYIYDEYNQPFLFPLDQSKYCHLFLQPSPRGSDRLLKNIHLDLDALGGGLHYEVDGTKTWEMGARCNQQFLCFTFDLVAISYYFI